MIKLEEELDQDRIVQFFIDSWNGLVEMYPNKRLFPTWCSEGDIQLQLSHRLQGKLPPEYVHVEFPIPLDVTAFSDQLWYNGRVKRTPGKCIVTDICVLDIDTLLPFLLAEVKFQPVYIGYYHLWYAHKLKEQGKDYSMTERHLNGLVRKLESWAKSGPSERAVDSIYLKNIQKYFSILRDFKEKEDCNVTGYLCVIDEVYPDLEDRLLNRIQELDPPENFRLLVKYISIRDSLEKVLKSLSQ